MSKRLTLLTTLLVALVVAVGALFCTTSVFADETETSQTVDLTELFSVTKGEADFALDTDGIKVTFGTCTDGKATIETKKAALKGTSFVWTGKTPANDTVDENGTVTFEFEGVTENSVAYLTGASVNGKQLFTVTNGEFKANEEAITGDIKLATEKTMLVGVAYDDVTLDLYQPFMTSVSGYGKAIVVGSGNSRKVYGTSAGSTTRHTVKFLDTVGTVKGYIFQGDYNKEDWADDKTLETAKEVMTHTYTVKDKSEVTIGAPEYKNLGSFDYESYNEKIENEIKEDGEFKYISSSTYFNIPEEIEDYISSEYFSNEDLNFEIYYKAPDSSAFTHLSSTSTRFSLSKLGAYEFYVLATDPLKNALEIDDEWELKIIGGTRGFYEGTTLKVPVFGFYMGNRGPQVEAASSSQNDGFVGSTYSGVKSFTIKGIDTTTEYTLWYNPKADIISTPEGKTEEAAKAEGWVKIGTKEEFDKVKATLFSDVKDVKFSDLAWSTSALTFKPVKTGSYAVECTVFDSEANTATGFTKVINVKSSVRTVTVDTTSVWFEKNWKSVLFLGIAGLSLIGIIVLLFVKPREEQDVMVKKS